MINKGASRFESVHSKNVDAENREETIAMDGNSPSSAPEKHIADLAVKRVHTNVAAKGERDRESCKDDDKISLTRFPDGKIRTWVGPDPKPR